MMEDSFCIGLSLKQRCTDREGKIIKIDTDDFSLVEVELLKVTSSIHEIDADDLSLVEVELLKVTSSIHEFDLVREVCKKHKNQLLRDYSANFKKCEDPFKKHKTSV